jgi:hypothetical protein
MRINAPICKMLSGQVGRGFSVVLRPATFSQDGSQGGMQELEELRSVDAIFRALDRLNETARSLPRTERLGQSR